ncbi:hypothetical protein GOL95_10055 [Sinorhizobium medicae]|nr:hypothetical protein [Sinorhizobium medicae]
MADLVRKPLETDVSLELAIRAHSGTSHTPDIRGRSEIKDYIAAVEGFACDVLAVASTEDQVSEAIEQIEKFRSAYVPRLQATWVSRSRIMSAMIAGPANFPVRRMEKAWASYEKKARELSSWRDRALKAAKKAIKVIGAPAPAVDPNAKTGSETKVIGGVEIVKNFDLDRVQIVFDGKPDSETISSLKGAGWNWSPRNSAWQRKLTNNAIYSAERIAAKAGA